MNDSPVKEWIAGVVLAGGQSSRMNFRFKPFLPLGQQTVIEHVIQTATPQVGQLSINANTRLDEFNRFGLPVFSDAVATVSGPLLGIYSAMAWYRQQTPVPGYLASFPADVPFFPPTLVNRLRLAVADSGAPVAWCRQQEQDQPLFALWSMTLFPEISQAIEEGFGGPRQLFRQLPNVCVVIDRDQIGDFLNINAPEDLETAEQLLRLRAKTEPASNPA